MRTSKTRLFQYRRRLHAQTSAYLEQNAHGHVSLAPLDGTVVGAMLTYDDDFSRREHPTKRDTNVLNTAQRAVDLAVKGVMRGDSESRKADLKVWAVTADPDHEKAVGGGIANTIATPARDGYLKDINTSISAGILKVADPSKMIKSSEGITAKGGDPALAVVGIHELAHGSDKNMLLPPGAKSEADVGEQVREVLKKLPEINKDAQ